VSDSELARLYNECRIVVVPLLLGGGIKGKIIEALWRGVPVITTAVGAEGIPNAPSGMVVSEPDDFAAALCALYQDTHQQKELINAGRKIVRAHYSKAAFTAALKDYIPELA
jgi:glycosyltransferase involved in cell wall biosynthesis